MKLKNALTIFIATFLAIPSIAQNIKPSSKGFAQGKDTKIYYEVYGQGKPLVLLHGAFYTIHMNWDALLPELAKTHKVIALEFQGHGHSPYSERTMTMQNFTDDVLAVMDHLKIDSADVAGYSMGGSVAYQFAVQHPKSLRRLVIISSTYKNSGWIPAVNTGFKDFKPEIFDNTPLQTGYNAVAPDKTKWHPFLKQMFVFADEPFDVGDSNIAKITAPVLIISGDNDGLDKVELAKTYQLLGGGVSADLSPMPKSRLAIVPGQSHVNLMMQTKIIARYMNEFLK
jgi:pimeloyl-ACP methyl ester carboxylesterase